MDEHVLDGITDDYFDAVPASDGVAVRMSDNVAEVLADLLHRLLRLLEDGQAEPRGRFRRSRSAEAVLCDMFPDAYRDRAEARSFRERHAAVLRDTTAVRRVRDRCVSGTEHVIDHAEVDDWVVALGLGRFLSARRDTRKIDTVGVWINHVQANLVVALNPKLRGR
jgi:hypothetical protein